jgi:hypothetical protein
MNPEVKIQWLAALRSGGYQQGRRALNSADGFCCLGVLCDLAVKAGVTHWGDPHSITGSTGVVHDACRKCDDEAGILPGPVQKWAGLEAANPWLQLQSAGHISKAEANDALRLSFPADRISMSEANDDLQLSFPEIADLIEAQL